MDDKMKDFENGTPENENVLLENYKGMPAKEHDSKQCYEKAGKEYESTEVAEPIKFTCIIAYNLEPEIVRWELVDLEGKILYASGDYLQYETWHHNFSSLNLGEGTLVRLKAVRTAKDDKFSSEILEYSSTTDTIFYNHSSSFIYVGSVPSIENPPVVKCEALTATHTKYPVLMHFDLINMENGKTLDSSGRCLKDNSWNFYLRNTGLPSGTRFKLKACVIAGPDSSPYIILEYDTTSTDRAYFGFYGNSFRTIVPYEG